MHVAGPEQPTAVFTGQDPDWHSREVRSLLSLANDVGRSRSPSVLPRTCRGGGLLVSCRSARCARVAPVLERPLPCSNPSTLPTVSAEAV